MAEGSRGRGILGRLLVALGFVWIFWGFLGPAVGLQFGNTFVDLPILPGFVILFIGRALSRRSGRGAIGSRQDPPAGSRVPPHSEPRVKQAPVSDRSARASLPVAEPVAVSDVIIEAFELPEPELPEPELPEPELPEPELPEPELPEPELPEPELPVLDEVPMKKTSAEMVAEARRRFGRRP